VSRHYAAAVGSLVLLAVAVVFGAGLTGFLFWLWLLAVLGRREEARHG
jgi:Na+/alanine symporter